MTREENNKPKNRAGSNREQQHLHEGTTGSKQRRQVHKMAAVKNIDRVEDQYTDDLHRYGNRNSSYRRTGS